MQKRLFQELQPSLIDICKSNITMYVYTVYTYAKGTYVPGLNHLPICHLYSS